MSTTIKKWGKKLLGCVSFTSAMFVFQACYGTPHDGYLDYYLEGNVKSKTTGEPIENIKIQVAHSKQYAMTDNRGNFSLYLEYGQNIKLRFEDIDSLENGYYQTLDTIIANVEDLIELNIELEEKDVQNQAGNIQ